MEDEMGDQVLIAYATKYGATAEIAEKIAQALRDGGLLVEVSSVERIKDLSPYKAVVLGSAIYIGKWRKEAVRFLQANERALTERPVWLFSSGPAGEGDPVELLRGWRLPEDLQPVADRIGPRDIAVFHGDVNESKLNFIEKRMIKMVESPVGDFRDWEAIAAWASAIAGELKGEDSARVDG